MEETGAGREVQMNANAKLWAQELRSGRYKQGASFLHKGDCLCCLGVGCAVFVERGGRIAVVTDSEGLVSYGGNTSSLPSEVQRWLGLRTEFGDYTVEGWGRSIAGDSDMHYSFRELADLIESEPKGLFVEEAQRA